MVCNAHPTKKEFSAAKECPEDVGESHVSIAPGILAKELRRCIRIADERTKDPAHLDSHEGVNNEPCPEQHTVPGIAIYERLVELPEQPLSCETGATEH